MITRTHHGAVAVLTIDRHGRRNALDLAHCDALREELTVAHEAGARSVVVTGVGSSFCAGADLDGVYGPAFRTALYAMLAAFVEVPVPIVAAVNGPAIGAGAQLAIAADLRVAAPGARFAVPTARNGLAVDPWTVRRLALVAGGAAARALLIGADTFDDNRSLGCGLADRSGTFDDALGWATELAELAPLSLAYAKLALTRLFEPPETPGDVEAAFAACWSSADIEEGRSARAAGRAPRFTGR